MSEYPPDDEPTLVLSKGPIAPPTPWSGIPPAVAPPKDEDDDEEDEPAQALDASEDDEEEEEEPLEEGQSGRFVFDSSAETSAAAAAHGDTGVIATVPGAAPPAPYEPAHSATRAVPRAPEAFTSTAVVPPPPTTDSVTCPECGTTATVTLTRREANDFCRNCDYPLFWTPTKILLASARLSDDSLRRLPGTVGRVTVASFPCPHCNEPNTLTAIDCIRCGRPLRPVRFEAPRPVYVPPPPEPIYIDAKTPWWVWAILAALVVGSFTLWLLYYTDTIK